jgi:hypothetical protein
MCHELQGPDGETTDGPDDPFNSLAVVTLGAVVDLPTSLIKKENQYQFLGTLDLLGRLNSRSIAGDIPAEAIRIDGAAHHLNTKIPAYLDVRKVLQKHLPNLPYMEGDDEEVRSVSLRELDRKAGTRRRAPVAAVSS